jgi:hypothetical protein
MHKLSKAEFGDLVKEIQRAIKKHAMKGGGLYDFAAAETYVEQLPDVPFFVHIDSMSGGGIKDSLKSVAKRVMSFVKSSGMADKAKQAALDQTQKLGKKAIDKVADKIESEASKRGHDVSHLTSRGKEAAGKALAGSEGTLKRELDRAHGKLEDKIRGSGMRQVGAGLMQTGDGMMVSGSGHYSGGASGFIARPTGTPGIPQGAMRVSASNHISSRMPAGGY